MASPKPETPDSERERKRDVVARFAKRGLTLGGEQLKLGESKLKQALGLGAVPNAIPAGTPNFNDQEREVHIGWHPVGGLAGKWFATETGLGKLITAKINSYPDPTQHWAVLVGDYAHQLWMDENFDVIYTNQKIVREEWTSFAVGRTQLNDEAMRVSGVAIIEQIRGTQPRYDLIDNNCQTYALRLLDFINNEKGVKFPTTAGIWARIRGPGAVADLYTQPEGEETPAGGAVNAAQSVMNHETAQVDTNKKAEESDMEDEVPTERGVIDGDSKENGGGEGKKGGLGAFTQFFRKKLKSPVPEST